METPADQKASILPNSGAVSSLSEHEVQPVALPNFEAQSASLHAHRAQPETLSNHKALPAAPPQHRVQPDTPYSWRSQPDSLPDQERLQSQAYSPAQLKSPTSGITVPKYTASDLAQPEVIAEPIHGPT